MDCLLEKEAKKVIEEFHKCDCGGHHYWKATTNKILRTRYFWPTMFKDIYKRIAACHECQIFEGRRKLVPLPFGSYLCGSTLLAVGVRLYWRNTSIIIRTTLLDSHNNGLLHQMDRSDLRKAS